MSFIFSLGNGRICFYTLWIAFTQCKCIGRSVYSVRNYHRRGTRQTLRVMDASDLTAPGSFCFKTFESKPRLDLPIFDVLSLFQSEGVSVYFLQMTTILVYLRGKDRKFHPIFCFISVWNLKDFLQSI